MKHFDWSNRDKYDINKVFNSYIAYTSDNSLLEEFLENVKNLTYFVLDINYSNVGSFDSDDLVAVSIEKVYFNLKNKIGIFKQPIDKLHPVGFCNYMKSILYSAIRGYLDGFSLHTVDVPELEYKCEKCGYEKPICHDVKRRLKVYCRRCNSLMKINMIRDCHSFNDYMVPEEYNNDINDCINTLYKIVTHFMYKHNRFDISDNIIKYYTDTRLNSNIILQKCLSQVYDSKHPAVDIDNLNFLFKWALSSVNDDYNDFRYERIVANAL